MVIENPMQFTIVSEVPRDSSGAFWATKVENKGESAITANAQTNKKTMNSTDEPANRKSGETMQHKHETVNAATATFFAPNFCEIIPLKTHANPPEAMIKNDKSETFRLIPR